MDNTYKILYMVYNLGNIMHIVYILTSIIRMKTNQLNDVEEEEILIPVGWKKIQAFEF